VTHVEGPLVYRTGASFDPAEGEEPKGVTVWGELTVVTAERSDGSVPERHQPKAY